MSKKTQNSQIPLILLLFFGVVFLVVASFFDFSHQLNELEEKKGSEALVSLSSQTETIFDYKIEGALSTLESLSMFIVEFSEFQSDEIMDTLKKIMALNGFERIGLADAEGNTRMTNGREANIQERDFYQRSMQGETVISELAESIDQTGTVFFLAVPIVHGETIRGVIYGVLNTTELSKELTENRSFSSYYAHIVDQNGNYVVQSTSPHSLAGKENLFDNLAAAKILSGSVEELQTAMQANESGFLEYEINGELRKVYYTPLGINGWYIYSAQRKTDIAAHYQDIRTDALFLTGRIAAALASMFLIISMLGKRASKQLKHSHEELRASEESLRIALAETDNAVFIYDVNTKTLIFKNTAAMYPGMGAVIENVPQSLIDKKIVCAESAEAFRQLFDEIHKKKNRAVTVIKTRAEGNANLWQRITLTNIFNDQHEIIRTVGVIEDVTEVRKKEDQAQQEARYREALSRDNLFTVDFNIDRNRIVSLVQSAETLVKEPVSGITFEAARDQAIADWVNPDDQLKVRQRLELSYLKKMFESNQNEFRIEARVIRENTPFWIELIGCLVKEKDDLHCILYCRNIDESKKIQERSERDALTGLYNRAAAEIRINETLRANPDKRHVFMLLDLDHFKNVNDSLGHNLGDQVLTDVAGKIKRNFRSDDIVVRLGGDEFVVFLKNIPDEAFAARAAGQLNNLVRSVYKNDEKTVPVSCSIGIVMAPKFGSDFQELYEKADVVLYEIKRSGRNSFAFYPPHEDGDGTDKK